MDVVVVADGPRMSLCVALMLLVAQKAAPNVRFNIALPLDMPVGDDLAFNIVGRFASSVYGIQPPTIVMEGQEYRIENKINALRGFGHRPALFLDSDMILLRPMPEGFLIRDVPVAVPEYGLHIYPWDEMFQSVGLVPPSINVIFGGGDVGRPWLNGGVVAAPDAKRLGDIWRTMADHVLRMENIPEKNPYLDQISLPLAMATLSPERTLTHANILPQQFNQHLLPFEDDRGYVRRGYIAHHHGYMTLFRKYFHRVITWVGDDFPEIHDVLERMNPFERQPDMEAT